METAKSSQLLATTVTWQSAIGEKNIGSWVSDGYHSQSTTQNCGKKVVENCDLELLISNKIY